MDLRARRRAELALAGASFHALSLAGLNLPLQVLACFSQGGLERAGVGLGVQNALRNLQAHLHMKGRPALALTFHDHFRGSDGGQTLPVVKVLVQHVVPGVADIEIQESKGGSHDGSMEAAHGHGRQGLGRRAP